MPSPRKRIGFLPRQEVQEIIDQICKKSKLSQSKVTGILVEEALTSRGVLNNTSDRKLYKIQVGEYNNNLMTNYNSGNVSKNEIDKFNLDKDYKNDEVQMINDFIEFKFFKNIMNKNKNKF